MKKFLVIYHASQSAMEKMNTVSSQDAKKGMEPWMKWAEKCGEALIDMGTPLGNGKKVTNDGAKDSDKQIVGYSMLEVESMEKAIELLKDHPHLAWTEGCEVEVHESLPMPGV
jgi:hypothetical protein